jgi:glycogen(starch) synthase
MRIALVSEIYPPRAGGAGWSTRALAMSLQEAGHDVRIVTTSAGPTDLDGLIISRLRFSGRKRFGIPRAIAQEVAALPSDVVIHAQHSLAVLGAHAVPDHRPYAATVRDHWPICFWSTRISRGQRCPECGVRAMTRCVSGRLPVPAPFSWGLIPYMRWDLRAKRAALHRASARIAVSAAIANELTTHGIEDIDVIPNVVHPTDVDDAVKNEPAFSLPERFLLFVGKLETNKGAHLLVPAVAAARTGLPLVVLGEGRLARQMKHDALAQGVPLVMRGWVHRHDVLRVLARATALVFPSFWAEPLSRVLLESLALGTPVAAIDTGGTSEIIVDGESGLLAHDVPSLADAVSRLAAHAGERQRLSEGARARAQMFTPEALVPRYEAVYRRVVSA